MVGTKQMLYGGGRKEDGKGFRSRITQSIWGVS